MIGRVLDLQFSTRTAALAYWQGQYVAIDRDEDAVRLAEISVPGPHASKAGTYAALVTVGFSSYECQTLPNLNAC